ncbi:hypothetical protein [Streptomyces sp. NBC_01304]|uniref:hypothetical protein n=1 Tax=Streptomyces sp. NBC_01304 TaxID=2903818 RepID=UPI002E13EE99|nr:hypothetical protein OG430_11480 [Streptomyces sp. NBC_01304]
MDAKALDLRFMQEAQRARQRGMGLIAGGAALLLWGLWLWLRLPDPDGYEADMDAWRQGIQYSLLLLVLSIPLLLSGSVLYAGANARLGVSEHMVKREQLQDEQRG